MLDGLLEDVGVNEGAPIAEIGAGTGILTQLLAERRLLVTAVEPSSDMRAQADSHPGVKWIDATFESTTLADSSQAWVIAAQAFHWADPSIALPEIRRILKTGGSFTALWNNRQNHDSEILTWTQKAISRHVPEFDHQYRQADWSNVLLSTGDFTEISYRREPHIVEMSRDRFLNLWSSHNRLNTQAGPRRMKGLLEDLAQFLESQVADTIHVPYACEAWTVR